MQLPPVLSLPVFQQLQSHTTYLTQLRILFPTVSLCAYTIHSWSLLKRDNPSLTPMPEELSDNELKVIQFTTQIS